MNILIGRKNEQSELMRLHASGEAELVVVYGRRRVGKTYLINQLFGDSNFAFKVTGLHRQKLPIQLKNFTLALREYFSSEDIATPSNWLDAFALLKKHLKATYTGSRRVLFFDELPWMDTQGSGFLTAFEWFWNSWGNAQNDIMLIICGSATNWIINKFFKNKGGLYNRSSSRLFLRPFTLLETEQYLEQQGFNFERYDITQIYMMMGGIPFYLKQLEPDRTLADNIDNCFFRSNGKLWDEFDNLFETLFLHSEKYLLVVQTLSDKHIGMTREEIIEQTRLPNNGATTKILKELIDCGFIRKYRYYGRKSKSVFYQLSDFYTIFYFAFIRQHYNQDEHFWTHSLDNPRKRAWLGFTFEQLCKDHIEPIKQALGIGSVMTEQSEWRITQQELNDESSSGAQIDLLIDRRDHAINICEIKFNDGMFTINKDYSMALKRKINTFRSATRTRKSLIPTMITTYGVNRNMYSNTIQQFVVLDDLFK